jgi:hypothetical protein
MREVLVRTPAKAPAKPGGHLETAKKKGLLKQPLLIRRSLFVIQKSVGGLVMHENGEQDNDWQRNA